MELGVLSQVTSNRRKQNDLKLHEGRLDLLLGKSFGMASQGDDGITIPEST